ncbi:MAG: hypothetical protein AAFV62_12735, partial [Pseudomonadota bacterium]
MAFAGFLSGQGARAASGKRRAAQQLGGIVAALKHFSNGKVAFDTAQSPDGLGEPDLVAGVLVEQREISHRHPEIG